jgi:hypothetical protein
VTALVTLPSSIVTYEDDGSAPAEAARAGAVVPGQEAVVPGQEPVDVAPDETIVLEDEVVVVADAAAEPTDDDDLLDELLDEPAETSMEVPQGEEFDRGLQSLVSDELPAGPVESDTPGTPPSEPATATAEAPAEAQPVPEVAVTTASAPEPATEEVVPDITAAGLVRRTPKKRSAESVGGGSAIMAARTSSQSQRSPEEVRKMLSRYRSGLNRGRTGPESENGDS